MRRGQAAMEFIITYGWAILVVLTMIAALAYYGILDFDNQLPEGIIISQGFSGADYYLGMTGTGEEFLVKLRNELPYAITIIGETRTFSCLNCIIERPEKCGYINHGEDEDGNELGAEPDEDYVVPSGEAFTISCKPGIGNSPEFPEAGVKEKIEFSFRYTIDNGHYERLAEGQLLARVEE